MENDFPLSQIALMLIRNQTLYIQAEQILLGYTKSLSSSFAQTEVYTHGSGMHEILEE